MAQFLADAQLPLAALAGVKVIGFRRRHPCRLYFAWFETRRSAPLLIMTVLLNRIDAQIVILRSGCKARLGACPAKAGRRALPMG
jgi:hypothetical protein